MRCVVVVSAVFLLTTALEVRHAHANPALLAAKAAQAASRAAQIGRAANAASKAGRMTKLGRIGSRAMRRVMSSRGFGGSSLKPNVLRLRLRKAMKQRGLKNFQRFTAERNKSFRALMKKRMDGVRAGSKTFAQKQLSKRMTSMNRLNGMNRMIRDKRFSFRKMQSLQRKSRAESNQRDADRRRQMRSHASEQRRRATQRGVFSTAMTHSLGAR